MAWIESHQSLRDHPKTKRAAHRLGVSSVTIVGHLQFLWWWALDYAQDGDLSVFDDFEIADASGWEGDPETFVRALIECGPGGRPGFIEETTTGRVLHDWMDFAGRLIERREAERERSRARREAKKAHESNKTKTNRRTTGGRPADVAQTADGTVPNQPYPTNQPRVRAREVVTEFGVEDSEFDRSLELHPVDDPERLPAIAEEFVVWYRDEKRKKPKSPYRAWLNWLKKDREFRARDAPARASPNRASNFVEADDWDAYMERELGIANGKEDRL